MAQYQERIEERYQDDRADASNLKKRKEQVKAIINKVELEQRQAN